MFWFGCLGLYCGLDTHDETTNRSITHTRDTIPMVPAAPNQGQGEAYAYVIVVAREPTGNQTNTTRLIRRFRLFRVSLKR